MMLSQGRRVGWITRWALAAVLLAPLGAAHAQADKSRPQAIVVDRVIATVNDAIILQSELRIRVLPMVADLENIADPQERMRRQSKLTSQVLEDMIAEELIVQAAQQATLQVEDGEVAAAVEEIKRQNNLDDRAFEQALAMQGMSLSAYKKDVRRQLLRMRAINMLVRPRVTVTDEDVRARYDELGRRSAAVNKVYLKHVLIGLPASPTPAQTDGARAKAAEVIERAKGGEVFSELAKQYSDDTATREGGGDLGWIERGSLPTEWEEVVFSMDKGEVRGPIKGPQGLHVFFVEDVKGSDRESFEQMKEQIRNELYRKEMDKQTGVWLEELRKKAHIDRKL